MSTSLLYHVFGLRGYRYLRTEYLNGQVLSGGPLEGTNNKFKTMKRQAYGFRDENFFKLKIMDLHNTKYALAG